MRRRVHARHLHARLPDRTDCATGTTCAGAASPRTARDVPPRDGLRRRTPADASDAPTPTSDVDVGRACRLPTRLPTRARATTRQGAGPDAGAAAPTVDADPLCLAACTATATAPGGLVCRALPGQAGPGSWASVCVPPHLRRIGDSCRDARGQLDDHVCATGLCADLGAIGLCSASCAAGAACPSGSACATFGDGRALCVATCSTTALCMNDPLLDCETGKGGGALGFLTSPPAPTATFCTPRTCTSQADCSPSGTCKPLGVGAHCVAN